MVKKFLHIELPTHRTFGLDILRALAIIFVVIGHGNHLLPPSIVGYIAPWVLDGVSIFFVLSGFLVGRILIKNLDAQGPTLNMLLTFWKRRWYRTLPNYFLILSILVLLSLAVSKEFSFTLAGPYFIFCQNLIEPHPWFFPEAWSLSVEEWFYLITPLCSVFVMRLSKNSVSWSILTTALLIIICSTYLRYHKFDSLLLETIVDWDSHVRKQVITRLDSLMFGVIGAYISLHFPLFWKKSRIPLFIFGLAILIEVQFNLFLDLAYFKMYYFVFSFSLMSVGILFLLPFLSTYDRDTGWIYKPLTIISLISYSLYLIHLTLIQGGLLVIAEEIELEVGTDLGISMLLYIAYWIMSIILSILLYKYWELPMMRLRDRGTAP